MIKIDLTNLRKYQKTILQAFPEEKNTLNIKYNYLYFDFDRKIIQAMNANNAMEVDFDFNVELNEEIEVKNFYVDLHKLFYILKSDEIKLNFEGENNSPIFYDDKSGKYGLASLFDSGKPFDTILKEDSIDIEVKLTPNDIKIIEESYKFYLPTLDELNASILTGNKIYCVPRVHIYGNTLSFDIGNKEVGIHKNVARIIPSIPDEVKMITVKEKKSPIILSTNNFLLLLEENVKYILPSQEDINNTYPKESFFAVNKEEILEVLDLFKPFYSTDSKPVEFKIEEDVLVCSVANSDDLIKKDITLVDYSPNMEDFVNKYNSSTLISMINLIKSEVIYFYANNSQVGIKVSSKEEGSRDLVLIKYV